MTHRDDIMRELALEEDKTDLRIAIEEYVRLDELLLDLSIGELSASDYVKIASALEDQTDVARQIASLVVSIGFPDVGAE